MHNIWEQGDPAAAGGADAAPTGIETDNSDSSAKDSPFTPAEERFLGKFDAYGSQHLGIIYSFSDIGIREFIARSGKDLNCTPAILLKMLRDKIIKIVPYTGFGLDDNYTLELQLSLDDVKGLGKEDKAKAEKGAAGGGGAAGAAGAPPAENAGVVRYGDILTESILATRKVLSEQKHKKAKDTEVYVKQSRVLNKIPKQYIKHLEQIIKMFDKKTKTTHEKQRIIADVLDNLAINFDLKPDQIKKSFDFFKNQKRLKKIYDNQ